MFKKFGTTSALLGVARSLNTTELRQAAERPPHLVVMGPSQHDAELIAAELTGIAATPYAHVAAFGDRVPDLDLADAVVVFDPGKSEVGRMFEATVQSANPACTVVRFPAESPIDAKAARQTRETILDKLPDRLTSFGRHFPAFRPAAVKQVIDETARANAKFALVVNVPSLLPFVGSIAGATADLIVITRNQAEMVYKLAAIHGRDLSDHIGIYKEIAPVVGAGFFWRTLAREAAAFLPFAAGTIPKVGIAYSGTITVGQGADYYYRTGKKPSKQQLAKYFRQAQETVKEFDLPGKMKRLRNGDLEVNYKVLEEEIA